MKPQTPGTLFSSPTLEGSCYPLPSAEREASLQPPPAQDAPRLVRVTGFVRKQTAGRIARGALCPAPRWLWSLGEPGLRSPTYSWCLHGLCLEGPSEVVWPGRLQLSRLFGELAEGRVSPALAETPRGVFGSFSPKAGASATRSRLRSFHTRVFSRGPFSQDGAPKCSPCPCTAFRSWKEPVCRSSRSTSCRRSCRSGTSAWPEVGGGMGRLLRGRLSRHGYWLPRFVTWGDVYGKTLVTRFGPLNFLFPAPVRASKAPSAFWGGVVCPSDA